MSKSSINKAILALTVTAGTLNEGELPLELTNDSKEFKEAEKQYAAVTKVRDSLVGAIASTVATEAKTAFADNDDVQIVTGSMDFGSTTLGAQVYRNYKADDESESIANYVVVTSNDDYTNVVNEAVAGIFDESSES